MKKEVNNLASYTTTLGNYVKFLRGTPTAWAKIPDSDKDKDTLYFISETDGSTGQLYLGPKLIIGEISNINNIGDLQDVLINEGVTANDVLVYDDENKKWVNKPLFNIISQLVTQMVGASETKNGASGLVPTPKMGDNKLYLRGDATWANPTEAVELTLKTVVGDDVGKSMRDVAKDEVLKVVDNAPEKFDTLKEIADWIESNTDATDIINLNNRVTNLEKTVGDENSGLVKDVSDLSDLVTKHEKALYGDEKNTGLIQTVSTLELTVATNTNNIKVLEERLKWQDINEE